MARKARRIKRGALEGMTVLGAVSRRWKASPLKGVSYRFGDWIELRSDALAGNESNSDFK